MAGSGFANGSGMKPSLQPPWVRWALGRKLCLPIASFPGGQITGANVRQMVTEAGAQTEAVLALQARFGSRFLLTCMDLSVEAEAFGAEVVFSDDEVPTVVGRRLGGGCEVAQLELPEVGAARTSVALEVVGRLVHHAPKCLVLAGITGPFSMAARLLGVSEALMLTVEDPESLLALVKKCARFLTHYVDALYQAGAAGVLMADPTAGLMSPSSLATFSAPAVKMVAAAVPDPGFAVILHHCAARAAHLPALFCAGVSAFHFGAPMDLVVALAAAGNETLILGNLDPASLFVSGSPESMHAAVADRIHRFGSDGRFVLSSGCDLPRETPLENLDAFFEAASAGGFVRF